MIEKKNASIHRYFLSSWLFPANPFQHHKLLLSSVNLFQQNSRWMEVVWHKAKIKIRGEKKMLEKAKNETDQKFNQINDDWVGSKAEAEDGLNETNDEVDGCNQDNEVYRQQIELGPGRDRPKREVSINDRTPEVHLNYEQCLKEAPHDCLKFTNTIFSTRLLFNVFSSIRRFRNFFHSLAS